MQDSESHSFGSLIQNMILLMQNYMLNMVLMDVGYDLVKTWLYSHKIWL